MKWEQLIVALIIVCTADASISVQLDRCSVERVSAVASILLLGWLLMWHRSKLCTSKRNGYGPMIILVALKNITIVSGAACDSYTCMSGLYKPDPASITCSGSCDELTCCYLTCGGHSCSNGLIKAGSATIVCTAICDDSECCDINLCDSYSCGSGSLKPTPANIQCSSSCTDGECCNTVLCDSHSCVAGVLKVNSASITCGSSCTDTECCDVRNCGGHSCMSGALKTSPGGITCASVCVDSECCDISTCNSYTCTIGSQKPNPQLVTCSAPTCTDTECCEGVCSFYTCVGGVLRTSPSMIPCTGGCDDNTCCELTCQGHVCTSSSLRVNSNTLRCLSSGCTDVLCCNQKCDSFNCAVGTSKGSSECSGDCDYSQCCEQTCNTYTCSSGVVKPLPVSISCGATPCDDSKCCDLVYCNTHTCGSGRQLFPTNNVIECPLGVCNDQLCCEPQTCRLFNCPSRIFAVPSSTECLPTGVCTELFCCTFICELHTCGMGVLKPNPRRIDCQGVCDDMKCCDKVFCNSFTCSPGLTFKPTHSSIECSTGTCSDTLCCDPLCSQHTCLSGILKPASSSIPCLAAGCDDTTCCEPRYCNSFTCTMGLVIPTGSTVECPLGVCTEALCCLPSCSPTHVCGVNKVFKTNPGQISCPSGCTDSLCCGDSCSGFTCPGLQKTTAAQLACPTAGCNEGLCCDSVCTGFVCTAGVLKGTAAMERCSTTGCNEVTCCDKVFCDTHLCGSGLLQKNSPSTLECQSGMCSDLQCCVSTCHMYGCSSGVIKPSPETISCASGCYDQICCDKVYCDGFQCTAGLLQRPTPSSRECTAGVCTDSICCFETCDGFMCTAGIIKNSPQNINCLGSGCDLNTCCNTMYCNDPSVACPAGSEKSRPDLIECFVQGCTTDICCYPPCSGYTCPSGSILKGSPQGIFCTTGSCSNQVCCDLLPRCDAYSCIGSAVLKSLPSTITCDPTGCDDATCCNPLCTLFQCSVGVLRPNPGLLVCSVGRCTESTCCENRYCDTYSCVTGYKKGSPQTILCVKGVCINSVCCDAPKDTLAPTAVPTTAIPMTLVPTQVPLTNIPTSIPVVNTMSPVVIPTPSPNVIVPQTVAPGLVTGSPTGVPVVNNETDIPTDSPPILVANQTESPSTESPQTSVPLAAVVTEVPPPSDVDKVSDRVEAASSATATAAAATAILTGAAAGQASQLAFVADITCRTREEWDNETLPFILHPTRLTVWGSSFSGAIVGNLLIVLSFVFICFTLKKFLKCSHFIQTLDVSGLLRFPSLPLFVFLFLYQGTTYAALRLIAYPNRKGVDILGGFVLLICVAVPMKLYNIIRRDVPETARYRVDDMKQNRFMSFFIGSGEWVSATQRVHWVKRYKTVISSYREVTATLVCSQFVVSLLLSVARVRFAESLVQCGHVRLACAGVFFAAFLLDMWKKPYCKPTHIYLISGINLSQVAGLICIAKGFYSEDLTDAAFDIGGIFIMIALIFLVIKTARRDRLQELEWSSKSITMEMMPERQCYADDNVCYTSISSEGESRRPRRYTVYEISDNDSLYSNQPLSRGAEYHPFPQMLWIDVDGLNDANVFSGSYLFDGMRSGSPSWSDGNRTLRQVRGRWELQENRGEYFKIVSDERHNNRLPHEMTSWSDQSGFPCDVNIRIDYSQQIQFPLSPNRSTPVPRSRSRTQWIPEDWNAPIIPMSPIDTSGRGSNLVFDAHRGETPTLGVPRYVRFVGSATPGGKATPLSGVAV